MMEKKTEQIMTWAGLPAEEYAEKVADRAVEISAKIPPEYREEQQRYELRVQDDDMDAEDVYRFTSARFNSPDDAIEYVRECYPGEYAHGLYEVDPVYRVRGRAALPASTGVRTAADHCGAHLRYAVIYEHIPTGEYVCTGIVCAEKTMSVPDRMNLRVKRLRALTTMRRERRKRKENAESRHPRATAILSGYFFAGGSNPFVLNVARRYSRHGFLSDRQAAAVERAVDRQVSRGAGADAADLRRRERGAELHQAGKVHRIEDGLYEVEGSGDQPYRVTLDPENCPCPDHEKENRCKHIYGALCAEKELTA